MNGREARLKEAYANEYPVNAPGVWMPVAEFAMKLVERAHNGRRQGRFTRTFDPAHFEFRGGAAKLRSPHVRTRSTDVKRRRSQDAEGLDSGRWSPDPTSP